METKHVQGLGFSSANFFLSQFYRSTNAVIAPQLIKDLSLDTEALGLLSAAFMASVSVLYAFTNDTRGQRK